MHSDINCSVSFLLKEIQCNLNPPLVFTPNLKNNVELLCIKLFSYYVPPNNKFKKAHFNFVLSSTHNKQFFALDFTPHSTPQIFKWLNATSGTTPLGQKQSIPQTK